VFDTEADGLLEEATKLHVLSCELHDGKVINISDEFIRIKKFLEYHLDKELPVVAHYGIFYDIPLLEKLLGVDLSKLMVIDTVALSWYLNVNREVHGLDSFFSDYGIAKPVISDWENLTPEEYQHRCREDVRINKALWEDFKERLVDMYSKAKEAIDSGLVDGTRQSPDEFCFLDQYKGNSSVTEYIDRLLTFLMFKCDCARLQEVTRFKVDIELLKKTEAELANKIEQAREELEVVMPKVPEYSVRKKPAKPFKKNGELSESGKSWNESIDMLGKKDNKGNLLAVEIEGSPDLKILKGYKEPNINSSDQLKDWFYSLGWTPKTFKFVKDKEAQQRWVDSGFRKELKPKPRMIPQINKDGEDGKELCDSVIELSEEVPEIMAYSKYSLIKHRLDCIRGFIRDMDKDGYLKARIGGFTNTLRVKHRELVNLVGVDKPYGKEIRGVLTCEEFEVLLGTDLSSLEDRVKHHFMIPHDPEYVATMMEDDFDPHALMALSSGMITKAEFDDFKKGIKPPHVKAARKAGKATNYASVYNAGAETIARSAGVDLATGKKLHEGYWKLNWAVKKIAEEQYVFKCNKGNTWLVNPINGFCYSLRKESDRFSTLCQGTGSYFFDMWVGNTLENMYETFKVKRLCGSWHDEYVLRFKDLQKNRDVMKGLVNKSIDQVNETYLLRRPLGCDIQFGKRYSDIH
jgi:DNA polymerase I-like protein with 3'-5' exonuclease and polymerase domains